MSMSVPLPCTRLRSSSSKPLFPRRSPPPRTAAQASSRSSPGLKGLEVVGARQSLLSSLESLQSPREPFPVVSWNAHLETLFTSFFRSSPDVALKRECLQMSSDGGTVALDWAASSAGLPFDSPILVLVPGLTAGSDTSYVRHMVARATRRGWRVVVSNHRGCADSPVTTPQFYSASFTGDLSEVVGHVTTRYSESKVCIIGWSLGANLLVRYLGQDGSDCPVSGAVSLCNPFNLVIANEDFQGSIYDKLIAKSLSATLKKNALLFKDIGEKYNIELACNAKCVRDFDEGLTHVSFGFESVDDYYNNASSSLSIKNVSTPLLCIQARNDPLAPSRGIPREDIKENPFCLLVVTPTGGHIGWVGGDEAPFGAPWTDEVALDFLEHLHRN